MEKKISKFFANVWGQIVDGFDLDDNDYSDSSNDESQLIENKTHTSLKDKGSDSSQVLITPGASALENGNKTEIEIAEKNPAELMLILYGIEELQKEYFYPSQQLFWRNDDILLLAYLAQQKLNYEYAHQTTLIASSTFNNFFKLNYTEKFIAEILLYLHNLSDKKSKSHSMQNNPAIGAFSIFRKANYNYLAETLINFESVKAPRPLESTWFDVDREAMSQTIFSNTAIAIDDDDDEDENDQEETQNLASTLDKKCCIM